MKLPSKIRISIHDLMPDTLSQVSEILDRHFDLPHFAPDLLVPGRSWSPEQIRKLQTWTDQGCRLVAHGWHHEIAQYGSLYHWLHGVFVSRRVAEHLALDSAGIRDLMIRSHDWFIEKDLPKPIYYVPPAWALGNLKSRDRQSLPFEFIEILKGDLQIESGELQKSPVVGYEADTPMRSVFLRQWNRRSIRRAIRKEQPLRLSIHPYDLHYHLQADLARILRHCRRNSKAS